jgi:hypothetical protein
MIPQEHPSPILQSKRNKKVEHSFRLPEPGVSLVITLITYASAIHNGGT